MATHTFDVTAFRAQFPAFSDPTAFPDVVLEGYWAMAICYINPDDSCFLSGACLQQILNLMTAHIARLFVLIGLGQNPAFIDSATIDKVTVNLLDPPSVNEWRWWLESTPYGVMALALLQAKSVGGYVIGGLPETLAFRKVAGVF